MDGDKDNVWNLYESGKNRFIFGDLEIFGMESTEQS